MKKNLCVVLAFKGQIYFSGIKPVCFKKNMNEMNHVEDFYCLSNQIIHIITF